MNSLIKRYVLKRYRYIGQSAIKETLNGQRQWVTATSTPMLFNTKAEAVRFAKATLKSTAGIFIEGPRGGQYMVDVLGKKEVV